MNDKRPSIPNDPGFFASIANYAKLVLGLMADSRVNPLLKLLPIASIIYVIVPFDILPLIPVDDIAVVAFLNYLFIELCPPEIVQELRGETPKTPGETVDGEWRDAGK
jgi:uncharacterized membrane protein YkvA (DUF1232 family)